MPRRTILTDRQRDALFALPVDESTLLNHYVLSDADLDHIRLRRRPQNRLGFALQLCAFRYPGRLLQPHELIPDAMLAFVGAQIGLTGDDLLGYGAREATRYQHSTALQRIYEYRPFEGRSRREMTAWLETAAEQARTNDQLAVAFVSELRSRKIIVPGSSTVERLCADALVAAERRIAARIAGRLDIRGRTRLLNLLDETVDQRLTRFVWLRQFEPGANSADVNRLLDRLDVLQDVYLGSDVLDGVPPHRVARLRRQGERYYADGLRDLPEARRLAILAVCAIEWRAMIADAVVETHDRIVGKLYRAAERRRDELLHERRGAIGKVLKSFAEVGTAIVAAREDDGDLAAAVEASGGWGIFENLVDRAVTLTRYVEADPLDFVTDGYTRFRRYVPRMLETIELRGGRAAAPLLEAIEVLRGLNRRAVARVPSDAPVAFARPKWRKRICPGGCLDRQVWETAILFELRNALRSGDLWLAESRRYCEVEAALVPAAAVPTVARLAVPLDPDTWLRERKIALGQRLESVGRAVHRGHLPGGAIENGRLHVDRLEKSVPDGAEKVVLQLYGAMPLARITDVLLEVDDNVGFTSVFSDLRTGTPCRDRIGLLSVLLADGVNLSLKKMADACDTHTFWELLRVARWHVREETTAHALAMIVEAQGALPMARFWGAGDTASSDGQHFPAGGMGEAMNVVNARYGHEPGLTAYSHVSDQYAPFATQVIPATAHEAPYILDGLLHNDAGRQIREHYADTGGFTDHVFAVCSILGFRFAPRIRDLPDKRLYAFDPKAAHSTLQPLIGGRVNVRLIHDNWPDILRLAASMATGAVIPSQILRRLAAYPRQNSLAVALREVGRVERSVFMLDWLSDRDLQRRAQMGLNKGEAHHALKRAINFNRLGEIRDRTSEGQQHRIAALNFLAAIVIYWNTWRLGEIVDRMVTAGQAPPPDLLTHVSPLGWEHITLTGEYRWPGLR